MAITGGKLMRWVASPMSLSPTPSPARQTVGCVVVQVYRQVVVMTTNSWIQIDVLCLRYTTRREPRLQWGEGDGGEKGRGGSEGNDREGSQHDLEPSTLPTTGFVRPRRARNDGIAAAQRGTSFPILDGVSQAATRVALLALNIPYFSWQFL